jgi:DNA-binding transcriptional regulator LsrR (DeoR family)
VTALKRLRQEYREPLSHVIRCYAIQGHSRRAVAQILELPQTTCQRLIKYVKADKYFKPYKDMRPETKNQWGRHGRPKS